MNLRRSGFTLMEVTAAVSVGLLVVLAAFAAVDAAAKVIAAGKRQTLEDELIGGAMRFLQTTRDADLTGIYFPTTAPLAYETAVLGVAATDYPAEWPRLTIARRSIAKDHGNGASSRSYQIVLTPPGSGPRTQLSVTVLSLQ